MRRSVGWRFEVDPLAGEPARLWRLDRRIKIPLYARVGIREVWLVDLTTVRLEVHREPLGDRDRDVRVLARDERVAPEAFPDLSLDVAELIG